MEKTETFKHYSTKFIFTRVVLPALCSTVGVMCFVIEPNEPIFQTLLSFTIFMSTTILIVSLRILNFIWRTQK